jgi:hypothetical protein
MKKRLARKIANLQFGAHCYKKPTRWTAYRLLVREHLRGLRRAGRITIEAFANNLPRTAYERSVELGKAYDELAQPPAAFAAAA